jgi:hypothetical protein
MRNLVIFIFMVLCISAVSTSVTATNAYAADSSFTQADRDRMIRVETKVDEGLKAVNQRIDDMKSDMNRRFEQMQTFMLWGFGILFGLFFSGMGFIMGFVLWDRRTALAPAVRKTKEIEEQTELLKKALKEAAVENPSLKEALKHAGLL